MVNRLRPLSCLFQLDSGKTILGRHMIRGHEQRQSTKRRGADLNCLVTLILADEEFGRLFSGKAKAMQLFMSGKLKIKGDVTKATRMEPILKKAQTTVKL